MKVHHIVVAGGKGNRFGSELPKQLHELDGRPVLMHTIDSLRLAHPGDITVAMHPDYIECWNDLCRRHGFESPEVVPGGETRWHSVRNALDSVPADAQAVTVHDAARPFVSPTMLAAAINAIEAGAAGAVPAVPVTESLRELAEDGSSEAVDRARYRAVQTPQVFSADILRKAYSRPYRPEFTDDASVVEAAGFRPIALIDGSPYNIKITHPADLEIASIYRRILNDAKAKND